MEAVVTTGVVEPVAAMPANHAVKPAKRWNGSVAVYAVSPVVAVLGTATAAMEGVFAIRVVTRICAAVTGAEGTVRVATIKCAMTSVFA